MISKLFNLNLGQSKANLTLYANVLDYDNNIHESEIYDNFYEAGSGIYNWGYDFPNYFAGSVMFYVSGTSTPIVSSSVNFRANALYEDFKEEIIDSNNNSFTNLNTYLNNNFQTIQDNFDDLDYPDINITLTPLQGNTPDRNSGVNITYYLNEVKNTNIFIFDNEGNEVEPNRPVSIHITTLTGCAKELIPDDQIEINNNQVSFINSAELTNVIGKYNWSLRSNYGGNNEVIIKGRINVEDSSYVEE